MIPLLPYLLITVKTIKFENSLLVLGKISGLFFNKLTGGQKYSLLNKDNLTPPTQMQLSLNGKASSELFSSFLKCR